MKAKRYTEEQIIGVLKEAEAGAKTKEAASGRCTADRAGSWSDARLRARWYLSIAVFLPEPMSGRHSFARADL